jgi:hypothetical protein
MRSRSLVHGLLVGLLIVCVWVPVSQVAADGNQWCWRRNTVTGAYGEAVVGTGDAIYIARKTRFYRYAPAGDSWTELAAPPNPDSGDAFKTGTALAWDSDDFIYALYGAATADSRRWFYRYSISGNSWEALANTPADQGEADAIVWVDTERCIYATLGGEQRPTYLMLYNASTNSWSDALTDPPAGMGDGASLVWTGGEFLYALGGEFDEFSPLYDFWRYSLSGDAWTAMADIPAHPHAGGDGGVGDGGSLLYVGFWLSNQTDFIYALSGNQAYPEAIPDNRTYRYTISLNTWESLADLPFGIGYYVGCRLGYADGCIYAWQGTPSTWDGGGDDLAYYSFPAPHPEYTLEIASAAEGTTDPPAGIHGFTAGTTLNVTALPNLGFSFAHWVFDGDDRSENPVTVVMDANHSLVPCFVDDIPPEIGAHMQEPAETVDAYQNVTVSVGVTDYGTGLYNVTLWYSISNGTAWLPLNMTETSADSYSAVIPGHDNCTWITYKIVAYDNRGNKAVDDADGFFYAYHVIPEFPLSMILPLFVLGTLLAFIVSREASKMYQPEPLLNMLYSYGKSG